MRTTTRQRDTQRHRDKSRVFISRRGLRKEVHGVARTMRETAHEDLTVAQAMRELGRHTFETTYGRPLERPFYPPRIERILDRAHRAECKRRFNTAARLMSHFFEAMMNITPEERIEESV